MSHIRSSRLLSFAEYKVHKAISQQEIALKYEPPVAYRNLQNFKCPVYMKTECSIELCDIRQVSRLATQRRGCSSAAF